MSGSYREGEGTGPRPAPLPSPRKRARRRASGRGAAAGNSQPATSRSPRPGCGPWLPPRPQPPGPAASPYSRVWPAPRPPCRPAPAAHPGRPPSPGPAAPQGGRPGPRVPPALPARPRGLRGEQRLPVAREPAAGLGQEGCLGVLFITKIARVIVDEGQAPGDSPYPQGTTATPNQAGGSCSLVPGGKRRHCPCESQGSIKTGPLLKVSPQNALSAKLTSAVPLRKSCLLPSHA